MGSNTAGETALTGTVVSVTTTGKRYTVNYTDAVYDGREDEVELTKFPTSLNRTHKLAENRSLDQTLASPTERPAGGRGMSYDIERRPVSKENFI